MNKLFHILRRPFRVSYRLAVLYRGETSPRQHHSLDGRLLRNMARGMQGMVQYWTLYKSGPFGLPEREVDSFKR